MVTIAPLTAAPLVSFTVPTILPVISCANATALMPSKRAAVNDRIGKVTLKSCFMGVPLVYLIEKWRLKLFDCPIEKQVLIGKSNETVFVRLLTSARSSRFLLSLKRKRFRKVISILKNLEPRKKFLPGIVSFTRRRRGKHCRSALTHRQWKNLQIGER